MAAGDHRVGKYFCLTYKSNPNLVLKVKDGADTVDIPVIVAESEIQTSDLMDRQLWYYDRFAQTLCNKLTGFGLHCNDDKTIVVRSTTQTGTQQKWFIDNEHIKLRSQDDVSVGVAGDVHEGLQCIATEVSENNCWMIDKQLPFYFYISSAGNTQLVVDVRKADRKPGAEVIVYSNKGDLADNQLWYEDENSILRSKLNGFALDATGKKVVLLPYDKGRKNQQWAICDAFIRNIEQGNLCISFRSGSLLSSPCLFADDGSGNQSDPANRLWKFTYIQHQATSLSHSGCGKFFNICTHVSNIVLQVQGKLIEPGSSVVTAEREKNALRQHFYQDNDTGTLRSALRNYCIDVDSNGFLVINPYDPYKKTQKWAVVGKKIQNRIDMNLVLQLCDTANSPGSQVTTAEYTGSQQQHWEFKHVPAKYFFIMTQMNGKVLDVKNDEVSAGAALIIFDRKLPSCPNQLWYEDENGILRSKLNGYVIDTRNGEGALRPYDPSIKQQHWIIVGDRIQNKYDSSQVLDVYGNNAFSSKVGQYKFIGGENQRWKFEMV